MKNIYLVGMPGCGKSTIGKQVSVIEKINFIDLDEYIVSAKKQSIEEMFAMGEDFFRKCETECLEVVSKLENNIVATGGGVVVTPCNIEIMKNTGTVIFIDTDPKVILKNSSLGGRPLLKDKNRIFTLYENRIKLYETAADYTVCNNGFLADTCDDVQRIINIHK